MPHPQFPIGSGFGAATTAQAVLAGLTCPTPPPSSPAATRPGTGNHPRAGPGRRARHRRGARRRGRPRADSRHRQGPGRTAGSRQAGQRARFRPALPGRRTACRHADLQRGHHGLPRDPRRAGLKPSSPPTTWAITRWPTCSGRRSGAARAWSPSRPPDTINPACAGTMCSSRGATTNGWPTGSRKPRTPCLPCIWTSWDESMACAPFAASRQDLHAAATPPDAGRNDGRGLAGRQRPASRPQLQDRAARRGHPDLGSRLAAAGRHGRPVLRGLRRRRAGPGRSSSFAGVRPHAVDPEAAARLWALSAGLTGIDAFAAR